MKFDSLLKKTSELPFFKIRFLSAGENLAKIRLQINRWIHDGRVIKLYKGLYMLSDIYRKVPCEPFCVANGLKAASYVSLHSALSWYGVIPEFAPTTISVTTEKPQKIQTPIGRFEFRNISKKHFWGYQQIELNSGQTAFVAKPEKALLDLVYLTPNGDKIDFIEELRLQNFEKISRVTLRDFANKFKSPKMLRALCNIEQILDEGEGTEL
jgi:predicted transcriptional regulator of viral defense system